MLLRRLKCLLYLLFAALGITSLLHSSDFKNARYLSHCEYKYTPFPSALYQKKIKLYAILIIFMRTVYTSSLVNYSLKPFVNDGLFAKNSCYVQQLCRKNKKCLRCKKPEEKSCEYLLHLQQINIFVAGAIMHCLMH